MKQLRTASVWTCLSAIVISLAACRSLEDSKPATPTVFTGGVAGFDALAQPSHSTNYRATGGGLYLHNNAWRGISIEQQGQILALFAEAPLAIELGFHPIDQWPIDYRQFYAGFDIDPVFITVNAFDGNNLPRPEEWARYTRGMRDAGVGEHTRILPTFEYANFGNNVATLSQNNLRDREDFQQIVIAAGGMVLDTPPQYFFAREQGYRDWVIDAIRWCGERELYTAIILSPHQSGSAFPEDADRYFDYLEEHGELPSAWVCENYVAQAPSDYPNLVGPETQPATTLNVGLQVLERTIAQGIQDEQDIHD